MSLIEVGFLHSGIIGCPPDCWEWSRLCYPEITLWFQRPPRDRFYRRVWDSTYLEYRDDPHNDLPAPACVVSLAYKDGLRHYCNGLPAHAADVADSDGLMVYSGLLPACEADPDDRDYSDLPVCEQLVVRGGLQY